MKKGQLKVILKKKVREAALNDLKNEVKVKKLKKMRDLEYKSETNALPGSNVPKVPKVHSEESVAAPGPEDQNSLGDPFRFWKNVPKSYLPLRRLYPPGHLGQPAHLPSVEKPEQSGDEQ